MSISDVFRNFLAIGFYDFNQFAQNVSNHGFYEVA